MIKPITKPELSECLYILTTAFEAGAVRFGQTEENCPYRGRTRLPLSVFEKEFLDGFKMYGYLYNDKLIGFLSLSFSDGTMAINDIAILPEHQNSGFGSALMQFAKEEAAKHKCAKIRLGMIDDNTELKNWYEKHGFKTVKLIKYEMVSYMVGKMELVL